MSGHSKWSKVKHQKESSDKARGQVFTKLANAITITVKESGGNVDPNSNFKLRLLIEKAKSVNMPKENINRAIERAIGAGEGEVLDQAVYEAFGPGGVGIIIEAATDNKQRTVAEVKNILERAGASLANTGSVMHFFALVGLLCVTKEKKSFDEVMEAAMDLGAIDLKDFDNSVNIYTKPAELHKVKEALEKAGFAIFSVELIYKPTITVPIDNPAIARQIRNLIAQLEERDDVQKVFANCEIANEISLQI